MIAALLSGVWPYIAGLLAAVGALFAVRQSGIKAERNRQAADRMESRLKAVKKKQEFKKNAKAKSDDELVAGSVRRRKR